MCSAGGRSPVIRRGRAHVASGVRNAVQCAASEARGRQWGTAVRRMATYQRPCSLNDRQAPALVQAMFRTRAAQFVRNQPRKSMYIRNILRPSRRDTGLRHAQVEPLESRQLLTGTVQIQIAPGFQLGPMHADPTRNVVYLADNTK